MAKLDNRKVRIHRLNGEAYCLNVHERIAYFSLRIGVYRYVLSNKYELVKFGDVMGTKDLLYKPVKAFYGNKPYWFAFKIPLNKQSEMKEICADRTKALLMSREPGLEAICSVKLKYFPDKDIDFKLW